MIDEVGEINVPAIIFIRKSNYVRFFADRIRWYIDYGAHVRTEAIAGQEIERGVFIRERGALAQ